MLRDLLAKIYRGLLKHRSYIVINIIGVIIGITCGLLLSLTVDMLCVHVFTL
jgi:hypothetical protein